MGTQTETAGIFVRYQESSENYLGRYDGIGNLEFMYGGKDGMWKYGPKEPFPITFGQPYWLRIVVINHDILIFGWVDGANEPAEWTLRYTMENPYPEGGFGLYGFGVQNGTGVQFDSFEVQPVTGSLLVPSES